MRDLPDQIADLSASLSERGALKLWSVIVTFLGDVAQSGATEVPGPVLSAVVARIGLQPQAMRVALHRLKRDGWVQSRRQARIGYYGLTEMARTQTDKVAPRVYGNAPRVQPLTLVVAPPDGFPGPHDEDTLLRLDRRIALVQSAQSLPAEDCLSAEMSEDMPAWVAGLISEAACEQDFQDLTGLFGAIAAPSRDQALDRLALRLLVLHGWRRLVLRSNPVAEMALGAQASVVSCRRRVYELLDALPIPRLTDVQNAA